MNVTTTIAVGLATVSFFGAYEQLRASAAHDTRHHISISADVGPLDGTIMHEQATGGYFALDTRHPVEQGPRRPAYYRGGCISDYYA